MHSVPFFTTSPTPSPTRPLHVPYTSPTSPTNFPSVVNFRLLHRSRRTGRGDGLLGVAALWSLAHLRVYCTNSPILAKGDQRRRLPCLIAQCHGVCAPAHMYRLLHRYWSACSKRAWSFQHKYISVGCVYACSLSAIPSRPERKKRSLRCFKGITRPCPAGPSPCNVGSTGVST